MARPPRPASRWPRPVPPRRVRRPPPASASASRRHEEVAEHRVAGRTTVAASPSTVAGATAGAARRLAGRETRLTEPESPATSGAVAEPAAALTARASARSGQTPRDRRCRDQVGASRTIAAVAATERANPASRASPGRGAAARRPPRPARAARRVGVPSRGPACDRPHGGGADDARARSSRHETDQEEHRGDRLRAAVDGPPLGGHRTAVRTIATFAPETAVRWASPARWKSSSSTGPSSACRRRRAPAAVRPDAGPGPARRR